MRFPFFQLDAFVDGPFSGNPAAVCILPGELDDDTLLAIARENNLSETAYLTRDKAGWSIRWFTPGAEVDLCGHATLAAGAVVLDRMPGAADTVRLASRSGPLGVERAGSGFALDFPAWRAAPARPEMAAAVAAALGARPEEVLAGPYLLAVFPGEADVLGLKPDMAAVAALPVPGLIASAPGSGSDFVSRFFAPALGVPEDPVTGSAHCLLTPFWAGRLGRSRLVARQVSARGGRLACEDRGARVRLAGEVKLVIEGEFRL